MNSLKHYLVKIKKGLVLKKILYAYKKDNYIELSNFRIADLHMLKKNYKDIYCKIQDAIYDNSRKKFHKCQKVKVAFVLYSASMWSCNELYRMMEHDERYEPYVVVAKYTNDSNKYTWPTFKMTTDFFEKENYKYITVSDKIKFNRGWEAMGSPDVVFYLTPYHTLLPVGINQGYLPSRVITIYIPYSYMLIKAEEKYDLPAFKYSWRHFCDSEIYKEILISHNSLYSRNTFFVGYPKMDAFFEKRIMDDEQLWKHGSAKKKIIFAPHHSLKDLTYCSSHFSTFDKNYKFMLELAKKYSDTTTWIYKPHPNLKKTVVMAGVFESEDEYETYLEEWDRLPNAKVVQEGAYVDYFKSSDAMICDSDSFLAEYQFTGKPLLLLTRPEQEFNDFGMMVQDILYKCSGDDTSQIEAFLSDVVIKEKDIMKKMRKNFFNNNLDYYHKNNCLTASEQIFNALTNFCFENQIIERTE